MFHASGFAPIIVKMETSAISSERVAPAFWALLMHGVSLLGGLPIDPASPSGSTPGHRVAGERSSPEPNTHGNGDFGSAYSRDTLCLVEWMPRRPWMLLPLHVHPSQNMLAVFIPQTTHPIPPSLLCALLKSSPPSLTR